LGEELEGLGLSPAASKRLEEIVKNRKKVFGLF